jgi:hypothetical protein
MNRYNKCSHTIKEQSSWDFAGEAWGRGVWGDRQVFLAEAAVLGITGCWLGPFCLPQLMPEASMLTFGGSTCQHHSYLKEVTSLWPWGPSRRCLKASGKTGSTRVKSEPLPWGGLWSAGLCVPAVPLLSACWPGVPQRHWDTNWEKRACLLDTPAAEDFPSFARLWL